MGNFANKNKQKDILTYSVSRSTGGGSVQVEVPIQQAYNRWDATDIIHHVSTMHGYLPGPVDVDTFSHLLACLKRSHQPECFDMAKERMTEALKQQKEQEKKKHKGSRFRVFPEEDILKKCAREKAQGDFKQIWTSKLRSLANRRISEAELNQLYPSKKYDTRYPGINYYSYYYHTYYRYYRYYGHLESAVVYGCSDSETV